VEIGEVCVVRFVWVWKECDGKGREWATDIDDMGRLRRDGGIVGDVNCQKS
jgi:hypothetical protein